MIIMRRPIRGWGIHNHRQVDVTGGFPGRPCAGPSAPMAPQFDATMSGPSYNGMDPSDPATWPRPYAPQPGMVARLNFDGAAIQSRTPTGGVQRGKTGGGRRRIRTTGA